MSYKKLEDLEIAKAYKIIKVNRFDGMYGETTTLILDDPRSGNSVENSVSYTHLTLPTIYSV